jgi:hypothetical protein
MTVESGDCFYCGEPTCHLGANPSRWPLNLPVDPSRPGVTKTVCAGCVLTRLRFADSLQAEVTSLNAVPPAGVATLVLRNLISRQEMMVEEAREDSSRGGWTYDWGSAHRELQAEIEKTIAAIRGEKEVSNGT